MATCTYWFETVTSALTVSCNTFVVRGAFFQNVIGIETMRSNVDDLDFQVYQSLAVNCVGYAPPEGSTFLQGAPFTMRNLKKMVVNAFCGYKCGGKDGQLLYARMNLGGNKVFVTHYNAFECYSDIKDCESPLLLYYGEVDASNCNITWCQCTGVAGCIAFEPENGDLTYLTCKRNTGNNGLLYFGNTEYMETAKFDKSVLIECTRTGSTFAYAFYISVTIGDVSFFDCGVVSFSATKGAEILKSTPWKSNTQVTIGGVVQTVVSPGKTPAVVQQNCFTPTVFFSPDINLFFRYGIYFIVEITASILITISPVIDKHVTNQYFLP